MKQSITKREIILIIITAISLAFAIVTGIHASNLKQEQADRNHANNTNLSDKNTELLEQSNYNDTICAEYRKLHQAYEQVRVQAPNAPGSDYSLPGAAKGEVDTCYQQ